MSHHGITRHEFVVVSFFHWWHVWRWLLQELTIEWTMRLREGVCPTLFRNQDPCTENFDWVWEQNMVAEKKLSGISSEQKDEQEVEIGEKDADEEVEADAEEGEEKYIRKSWTSRYGGPLQKLIPIRSNLKWYDSSVSIWTNISLYNNEACNCYVHMVGNLYWTRVRCSIYCACTVYSTYTMCTWCTFCTHCMHCVLFTCARVIHT